MSTVTHRVKKLFIANPMRMEISRFRSRFLHSTGSPVFNRALVVMLLVCYLGILGAVLSIRKDVTPSVVILIQSIATLVLAPLCSYGLIAGERDRRSWDLLQVAPVTFGQIVVGKFMGALAAIGAVSLAFLPVVCIGMIFGPMQSAYSLVLMELVTLSAAAAACAVTLYMSARLKNANTALAVSIASLVGVLVALPMVLSTLIHTSSNQVMDLVFWWHPVYVVARIMAAGYDYRVADSLNLNYLSPLYGWPQFICYLGLTWVTLGATTRCLRKRAGKE